ncbi:hypothetical protein CAEBREN_23529 [Caenorhabditis brenneri]|uniref:Uncharacterized protein n=1 Tax=Caenorhabditis brenneri TaxID=135651 RepID=G0N4D8_CAEBE|nr:hypothetical protein CAEBREN_23529 [Caenorhabditis brenneri]
MEAMKNYSLVIMGSKRVGKSSLRSALSHYRKDFSNMGPTETVTFSADTFLNNHISMRDYGTTEEGMRLQLHRTTYKKVDGLIFVFNAVAEDRAGELEHFLKVWKMLASESPNAKVYIFYHRTDLIQGSRTEALCSFGMELKGSMVEAQARPHELKLMATSVFDRESVSGAWSTVFRSLCGSPEGWSQRLTTFGVGMGFDQVLVFDKRHKMLVKNITLDETKRALNNFECQTRVAGWWESRDRIDGLVIEGKRRIYIHEYAYNSILIGVTDNDTITPFSWRVAVKGSKTLERKWDARNRKGHKMSPMDEKDKDRSRNNASQSSSDSEPIINIMVESLRINHLDLK